MSTEGKAMTLPDPHTQLRGEASEGWAIATMFAAKRREQEEIGDKIESGELTAEAAAAVMPLCNEVDQRGFEGMAQAIAHLMALGMFVQGATNDAVEEMHRHYPDEIRGMLELATRQADENAGEKAEFISAEGAGSLPEGHVVVEHLGTH